MDKETREFLIGMESRLKDYIDKSLEEKLEIKKEIEELKEKLNRKIKEDKESFKANNARLNKVELTQEYFEVKIDDLKKVKSKVAV